MNSYSAILVTPHQLDFLLYRFFLEYKYQFKKVDYCKDYNHAFKMVQNTNPDITIIVEPEADHGINFSRVVAAFDKEAKIMVISKHSRLVYATRLMKLGARGFVTRNSSFEELGSVITEVLKGNIAVSEDVKNLLVEENFRDEECQPVINALTRRELEIVNFLRSGLSSKEIGETLGRSVKTVQAHRYNILKKLKFRNTTALMGYLHNTSVFD